MYISEQLAIKAVLLILLYALLYGDSKYLPMVERRPPFYVGSIS